MEYFKIICDEGYTGTLGLVARRDCKEARK